jgi:adenylate kinase family enzyme
MNPVYLFIGQSGAGKGTQVALLKERLLKNNPETAFFSIETGEKFRSFIAGTSYSASLTREAMAHGILPPPFLAVQMWAQEMMEHYDGKSVVFLDGTPRVASEVPLLLSAAEFYGWTLEVIHLTVGDDWSFDRITGRGRPDDAIEHAVRGRIAWYHTSVEPAVQLLKASPLVNMHDIHGEQSIEAVHEEICAVLGIQ